MTVDAQQAAMLVRVTARVSAVIVAGNLLAATRRAESVGSSALRAMDVATFVAFLASHTVHFACVWLLAVATAGDNIRRAGGWMLVDIAALAFYAGAGIVLRVKLRPRGWRSAPSAASSSFCSSSSGWCSFRRMPFDCSNPGSSPPSRRCLHIRLQASSAPP
jgi:hypothetical protein